MTRLYLLGIAIFLTFDILAQQLPSKFEIINSLKSVNNYWIAQNQNPGNNQWARATYFTGNMDFYKVYNKETYLQYTNLWANNNAWTLNGGTSTRNADNQTVGQVYIDLYKMDGSKQPSKIYAIKTCIDKMVDSSKVDDWWWVDALYMAMPNFARLGILYNDSSYFDKMYALYCNTKYTRGLYNASENLWYRDESFDPPNYTPNGEDIYWSRGNGWVFAAHAKVLQLLPENNINRNEYIETFQKMALALKDRQRTDGFWNASLDDPNHYGGPETSGTSFFTYGIAWGINNGLLDSATYHPIVVKAWDGLSTIAVQPNGFLGYVQGVGSSPALASSYNTADFGVGAFLLAGSEVVKLADGEMPAPTNFSLTSVKALSNQSIKIIFNKSADDTTALTSSNYTINNGVSVTSVSKGETDSIYILTVDGLNFGLYELQVTNVKSQDNNPIETDETKTFSYSGISEITAIGYEANTSNSPDKTLDFDFSTRWSYEGIGVWITYDLGDIKQVTSVDLAFYKGNERTSYFSIQISSNGIDFTEVFSGESSGSTLNLENYNFTDQNARYIKIIGNGNSASLWNSITETRINWNVLTSLKHNFSYPKNKLAISPNPMIGNELTIELNNDINEGCIIYITELNGREVYSKSTDIEGNRVKLEAVNLNKGVYIVTLQSKPFVQSGLLYVE